MAELLKLFEDIINSDGSPALEEKINRLMREIFSKVITEREECINTVAVFLARSDDIEPHQKRRFESIYKEYNPGERIVFQSKQLSSIISLFLNDNNENYNSYSRLLNSQII